MGAIVMRGAGCTWNDLVDRDLDSQVRRTRSRPLPAGSVSVNQARAWMLLQAGAGLLILITFNGAAIILGIAALVPVLFYPFAKRFTWLPQIALGIAFNWGALLAWTAHAGGLSTAPVLLYVAGIMWTLFYDTIYAHQDKEDDALIGIKSTARLLSDATPAWLTAFAAGTCGLLVAAILVAIPYQSEPLLVLICLSGVALFATHLFWQLRRLDINDADCCLRLFRSNRDTGLILSGAFLTAAVAGCV